MGERVRSGSRVRRWQGPRERWWCLGAGPTGGTEFLLSLQSQGPDLRGALIPKCKDVCLQSRSDNASQEGLNSSVNNEIIVNSSEIFLF